MKWIWPFFYETVLTMISSCWIIVKSGIFYMKPVLDVCLLQYKQAKNRIKCTLHKNITDFVICTTQEFVVRKCSSIISL